MNAQIQEDLATSVDGQRITQAIVYLAENFELQSTLDEAAEAAGLSGPHFQRLFRRFIGVSPKKFIQHLALNRARESLSATANVFDASHDAGSSGLGRRYGLLVTCESMTPVEWKAEDVGKNIVYGWHPSPFGECLIAATERGICGLAFELKEGRDITMANLFNSLGEVSRNEDRATTKRYADLSFDGGSLKVLLRGTPYQLKVWEGLMSIPPGAVTSYEGLARKLGRPTSARAVAGAVARNPVSWLVPCHRVLRRTGEIAGYRWGPSRKRSMLAYEAAAMDEVVA